MEIYNEQVYDLLDAATRALQLRENIKRGVFCDGIIEQTVNSAAEAYEVNDKKMVSILILLQFLRLNILKMPQHWRTYCPLLLAVIAPSLTMECNYPCFITLIDGAQNCTMRFNAAQGPFVPWNWCTSILRSP